MHSFFNKSFFEKSEVDKDVKKTVAPAEAVSDVIETKQPQQTDTSKNPENLLNDFLKFTYQAEPYYFSNYISDNPAQDLLEKMKIFREEKEGKHNNPEFNKLKAQVEVVLDEIIKWINIQSWHKKTEKNDAMKEKMRNELIKFKVNFFNAFISNVTAIQLYSQGKRCLENILFQIKHNPNVDLSKSIISNLATDQGICSAGVYLNIEEANNRFSNDVSEYFKLQRLNTIEQVAKIFRAHLPSRWKNDDKPRERAMYIFMDKGMEKHFVRVLVNHVADKYHIPKIFDEWAVPEGLVYKEMVDHKLLAYFELYLEQSWVVELFFRFLTQEFVREATLVKTAKDVEQFSKKLDFIGKDKQFCNDIFSPYEKKGDKRINISDKVSDVNDPDLLFASSHEVFDDETAAHPLMTSDDVEQKIKMSIYRRFIESGLINDKAFLTYQYHPKELSFYSAELHILRDSPQLSWVKKPDGNIVSFVDFLQGKEFIAKINEKSKFWVDFKSNNQSISAEEKELYIKRNQDFAIKMPILNQKKLIHFLISQELIDFIIFNIEFLQKSVYQEFTKKIEYYLDSAFHRFALQYYKNEKARQLFIFYWNKVKTPSTLGHAINSVNMKQYPVENFLVYVLSSFADFSFDPGSLREILTYYEDKEFFEHLIASGFKCFGGASFIRFTPIFAGHEIGVNELKCNRTSFNAMINSCGDMSNFDGIILDSSSLIEMNLYYISLRNASLINVDFSEAKVNDVNLPGANLTDANLRFSDFGCLQLDGAVFSALTLETFLQATSRKKLTPAIYDLRNIKFVNSKGDYSEITCKNCFIDGDVGKQLYELGVRKMISCKITGNFSKTKLTGMDFSDSLLENIDFRDTDLSHVNFKGVTFSNGNMNGTIYVGIPQNSLKKFLPFCDGQKTIYSICKEIITEKLGSLEKSRLSYLYKDSIESCKNILGLFHSHQTVHDICEVALSSSTSVIKEILSFCATVEMNQQQHLLQQIEKKPESKEQPPKLNLG